MATITSAGSGNWGDAGTWDVRVPLAGDAVIIATGHVVVDNVSRIPATSGTLLSLSAQTTGEVTIDISAGSKSIYSDAITGHTPSAANRGFIYISGSGAGNTITIESAAITGGAASGGVAVMGQHSAGTVAINATTILGGAGLSASGVYNRSTGIVNITGISGGRVTVKGTDTTATASYGAQCYYTACTTNLTNADITGGTGARPGGFGFSNSGGSAVVTCTNCNLIDGVGSVAWYGTPPTFVTTSKVNYHQMPTVNADGRGSQAMRFYLPPKEHEVLKDVVGGFENGANPPSYAAAGTLQGTIDNSGVVHALGIIDTVGDWYEYGTLENTSGVYAVYGIIEGSGVAFPSGILDNAQVWSAYGVLTNIADRYEAGVLENSGADYYTLADTGSTPYVAGDAAGQITGAAAQKVTDAAFLELNLDEMIALNTDIQAEFSVSAGTGDASFVINYSNTVITRK